VHYNVDSNDAEREKTIEITFFTSLTIENFTVNVDMVGIVIVVMNICACVFVLINLKKLNNVFFSLMTDSLYH
jgi:hypothetical protein